MADHVPEHDPTPSSRPTVSPQTGLRPTSPSAAGHAVGAGAIEVRHLFKSFHTLPVLRNLDLSLGWGECLALFGPNGSGKTTLVRVLATLAGYDQGSVRIASYDPLSQAASVRQSIGVLTHQTFLYDHLTGLENLRFYGRMFQVPDLAARIETVASHLRIEPVLGRRTHTLSHGMQKRVSLARALLHRPRVLLLDEPGAGLDPEALSLVERLLQEHRERGGAVLMTTHDVEEGLALADRVAVLSGGRLAFQAARGEVTTQEFRKLYHQLAGTPV